MTSPPIERDDENPASLTEKIYARLDEEIASGRLAPGARLREPGLSARFGVSRGPIREALRRLEQRGIVTSEPHLGARVVSFTANDLLNLCEVREALEGAAAGAAALAMPEATIQALAAELDRTEQALRAGPAPEPERGLDFHDTIARASDNPFFVRLLCEQLLALIRICRNQVVGRPPDPLEVVAEHREVLAAITARDPRRAERAMREHVGRIRARLLAGLRP